MSAAAAKSQRFSALRSLRPLAGAPGQPGAQPADDGEADLAQLANEAVAGAADAAEAAAAPAAASSEEEADVGRAKGARKRKRTAPVVLPAVAASTSAASRLAMSSVARSAKQEAASAPRVAGASLQRANVTFSGGARPETAAVSVVTTAAVGGRHGAREATFLTGRATSCRPTSSCARRAPPSASGPSSPTGTRDWRACPTC